MHNCHLWLLQICLEGWICLAMLYWKLFISYLIIILILLPFYMYHSYLKTVNDSYVDYWAWFLLLGTDACDNGNTPNNDGWKQIGSSLRSEFPSSISPCFGKLELLLLNLGSPFSEPDRFSRDPQFERWLKSQNRRMRRQQPKCIINIIYC